MGALRFLELMPEAGGGDALDLCGGAGSGAFRLSRTARSAATSDLTPRSAHFAAFNARLNGVDVESLQGDLYAPAAGRRFDVIAAHPPYVPEAGSLFVYRDGGDTGERVTREWSRAFPAHLQPGGRCAILCMGRDAEEGTFEQRVRGWLGEARDEFDVVFGLETTLTGKTWSTGCGSGTSLSPTRRSGPFASFSARRGRASSSTAFFGSSVSRNRHRSSLFGSG